MFKLLFDNYLSNNNNYHSVKSYLQQRKKY